jgi:hypothetical protein
MTTTTTDKPKTSAPKRAKPELNRLEQLVAGYKGERTPLGAYAAILGVFGAVTAAGLLAASRRRPEGAQPLQDRASLGDLALLGVATHKVSRLLTRDWVTAPLRAPFTEYQGTEEAGEVKEEARGEGMQLAVGQVFT